LKKKKKSFILNQMFPAKPTARKFSIFILLCQRSCLLPYMVLAACQKRKRKKKETPRRKGNEKGWHTPRRSPLVSSAMNKLVFSLRVL